MALKCNTKNKEQPLRKSQWMNKGCADSYDAFACHANDKHELQTGDYINSEHAETSLQCYNI
jgi:hypothetical protein